MYGKLFVQMYDGTLATKGPWQALVTFQQLLILADKHGVIDMTAEAIARRTTIPLEIIEAGIQKLLEADDQSRSPDENGKRIVPLSDTRNWGWKVVNYEHYRAIRSEDERREYHKQYMRKVRAVNQIVKVSTLGDECQPIAISNKQQAKALKTLSGKPDDALEVLNFLNLKTGRAYRPTDSNLGMIKARLKDGSTVADCKQVIARKTMDWLQDDTMRQYLRPATLFNRTKFDQYTGELVL